MIIIGRKKDGFNKGQAGRLNKLLPAAGLLAWTLSAGSFSVQAASVPVQKEVQVFSAAERLAPAMNRYMVRQLQAGDNYMTALYNRLLRLLGEYDGTWSVYMKDLTTGEELLIGDRTMHSASTLKLFILGAVYRAIEDGALERTSELVELMSSMIRASSNTAANELIRRLGDGDFAYGMDVVNAYIQAEGYSEATVLYNGFQEESLHLNPDMTNSTCAKDAGLLLERVYRRSFARRAVCNEVEEWMLGQGTRYKIPKGLPDGVLVGNKTGETDSIENDCAVVYTPLGDYILCVFSSDWSDKETAQTRITAISAMVYSYFSGNASAEAVLHLPGDYDYAEPETEAVSEIAVPEAAENAAEEEAVESVTESAESMPEAGSSKTVAEEGTSEAVSEAAENTLQNTKQNHTAENMLKKLGKSLLPGR